MAKAFEKLCEEIHCQQKGHENKPEWYVGEQIKDICRNSEEFSEIVLSDINNKEMGIKDVEEKIRCKAKSLGGCCPPNEADKIIREFYGLGAEVQSVPDSTGSVIDLATFL